MYAEQLQQTPEIISRRTDDIAFNVRYLTQHCIDVERGLFETHAEHDVLQQDKTEIAEADIHKLAPIVHQTLDDELGQYTSLGGGTVDNNIRGCLALDMQDQNNHFEFYRRVEEITDEVNVLEPYYRERMKQGAKKVFMSPSPTHHEVDPDVAVEFGYDDRTMFRIQDLSPDARQK